jgi:hypothetical protein
VTPLYGIDPENHFFRDRWRRFSDSRLIRLIKSG